MSIHRVMKEKDYDALIIISDSWHTVLPPEMSKEEYLRRRDEGEKFERGEGLVMLCCGKDIIPQTTTLSYTRKGKEIVWGEQHTVYEFENWMVPKEWAPLPLSKGSA